MINEKLKYYKGIEKDYDLDKLNTKGIELFEIVNKYQFYGKRAGSVYLKVLYKLGYFIALHLAKSENASALKNKKFRILSLLKYFCLHFILILYIM